MPLPGAGPGIDTRAITGAIGLQLLAAIVITGVNLPLVVALVLPLIGGIAAGVWSRNFEEEFLDGAIAAGAAPVLVPAAGLVTTWITNPAIPDQLILNVGSLIFSVGIPLILIAVTMSSLVGAVVSHRAASLRRQAAGGIEIK